MLNTLLPVNRQEVCPQLLLHHPISKSSNKELFCPKYPPKISQFLVLVSIVYATLFDNVIKAIAV